MGVDDHGLEALKKSAEQVVSGNKSDYYLKIGPTPGQTIQVMNGWLWANPGRSIHRTDVNATTEDYSFQQDLVEQMKIRVIYSDSSKGVLQSASRLV